MYVGAMYYFLNFYGYKSMLPSFFRLCGLQIIAYTYI